jgi:hypothetical protein
MPMLCCSPDFTNPDGDARKRAVDREDELVGVARRLGGQGTDCRVPSGQRYPGVSRERGLAWVVQCINQVLPVAREHDMVLVLETTTRTASGVIPSSRRSRMSSWPC